MKQDGLLVDEIHYNRKLKRYESEPYFYLGNANPYRGQNFKEFYGYVSDFKIWNNDVLVIDLDFDNYFWPNIKNKTNKIVGEVFDCEKRTIMENSNTILSIPKRRKSLFKLLEHSSNGFYNGKWIHSETRHNQIKYSKSLDNSGLNNITYNITDSVDNHLKVAL
jgi:hypothetical protein